MIPVYVCDDEPFIRENLTQIVDSQILILDCDMGPVRALEDPDELLRAQREASVPAIYFLDIDFPGKMSGLVLAQKLRQYDPRGFIIFITAHSDLAFETFRLRLEALDYIVKGSRGAMTGRVQKCLESIQERKFWIPYVIFRWKAFCILKPWESAIRCVCTWMTSCWNSTAASTILHSSLAMASGAATAAFL